MSSFSDSRSYRAAWVLPVTGPPIPNGIITVGEGKITAIGVSVAGANSNAVIDLGDVALIPGLVNAHTHLEFSDLVAPLGRRGIDFTDWVRLVVGYRRAASETVSAKATVIERGLQECFRHGTWVVGEIATAPVNQADYRFALKSGVNVTLFHERLGSDAESVTPAISGLATWFSNFEDELIHAAVSPHAPYSVHPKLLQALCELAVAHRSPVAMHVAETLAERELLENQSGSFVSLLKDFGVWNTENFSSPRSILSILHTLAQTPRSLVVHANYLNSAEIDFVALHQSKMSIVYCPRTHAYFQHEKYPLEEFLNRQIPVAVGTDSRASNPDLNLFAELQHIARLFPHVSKRDILSMGTINGAKALGLDHDYGSLEVGKRAALSFCKLPLNGCSSDLIWELLFDSATNCQPLV